MNNFTFVEYLLSCLFQKRMSRKTLQNVHAKFGKFFFFYRIISRDAILQVFDENKIEYNAERLVVVSEPIVSFLGSEVNLSYTHRLFY